MSLTLVVPLDSFENIVLFLFLTFLATGIIVFNLTVFISISFNKALQNENRFLYMQSTSVSDVCTGIVYYYVGLFDVQDILASPTRTYYIAPTFLGISYMITLASQADRYHAVASPFKYSQRMTRKRTILIIVCLWSWAFLIAAVNNVVPVGVSSKVTVIGTFASNICTVAIMIVLNIKLFIIARFQINKEPPSAERDNKKKSIYLIIVVVLFFLITWTPAYIHNMICNVTGSRCFLFRNEGTDPLRILPRINALITPLLYTWGCASLRQSLISKIGSACRMKDR